MQRIGAARLVPVLLLVAAAIVIVVLVAGSGGDGHHKVVIRAATATWIVPGLDVQIAGKVVGQVSKAEPTRAGTARVELALDRSAWPLPVGTKATFRWASTIAQTNRYVRLELPKATGRWIPEGGTIGGADAVRDVEMDDLAGVFDKPRRAQLKQFVDDAGTTLRASQGGLSRTLDRTPPALAEAEAAIGEVGQNSATLETLVRSTDDVVHAIQSADPGLGSAVDDSATTLAAVADESEALRTMLERLPRTLDTARATLVPARRTLHSADDVLARLAPGVDQTHLLARPLNDVLGSVRAVGPDARATLAAARRMTPDLNPLLDRARDVLPQVAHIGRQAGEQLACIRPYTPEIAGMATTWVGFMSNSDGKDKFMRVNATAYPYLSSSTAASSADVVRLVPSLKFIYPAPPGAVAGQPWFIPSCGVGPETMDATKDPERPR